MGFYLVYLIMKDSQHEARVQTLRKLQVFFVCERKCTIAVLSVL